MKKNLEVLSIILATVLFIALFSGCVEKKTIEKGEATTVKWYLPGDKLNDVQLVLDAANKIIEPKVGAKLDMQFIDTGSYQDKMNMMIAAGTEFDMCFTSDWTNLFMPLVNKGGFLALNDLIDKNAPELKKALPDYVWNAPSVNGKIYAVPNLQVMFYQTSFTIMKKYADKYKLDVSKIKKAEDIEPFLEQIKNGEPDVYPYRPHFLASVFTSPYYEDISGTGVSVKKDGIDSKLFIISKSDEYKNGIKTLRKWFEKGYIRPDVASVMNDNQDYDAGKYAVSQDSYKPGNEAEVFEQLKQEVVFVPLEEPYLKANAGMSAMTAISRTSKNAEKAIKIIELINTDKKLYNLLCFGIEGKHYTKINDSQIDVKSDSGYNPNAAWKFGNQFNAYYLNNQKPGIWEETSKLNSASKKSPLAGFVLDTTPIKVELTQMSTVNSEFSGLENGSVDPDKMYDTFIQKLDKGGIQKVYTEVQKQYDVWLAKKK